jgi:hypothetical protein
MLTNTIMDRKCYALRLSNLPSRLQPTLKLSSRQAHAQSRLRVRSTAASDDEPPTVGDWRSFRSQLMRTDGGTYPLKLALISLRCIGVFAGQSAGNVKL